MKRVAVLTSGGDAPGMNAAIRAVVRTAANCHLLSFGIRNGFAGLIAGDLVPLGPRDVGGIIHLGGTILGSARSEAFRTDAGQRTALGRLEERGIDGLVVVGGNGSQAGAHALAQLGFPVVGAASTIDNDLFGSDLAIGVDTALNIALEAIDRLRTTAASHRRILLVEVMGRESGYLALHAGVAGGAEAVVLPEVHLEPRALAEELRQAYERGKSHAIVVVAEGAQRDAAAIAAYFNEHRERFEFEVRMTVLGHVQRGGVPTAFDRLLATRLGAAAVDCLSRGEWEVLVGLTNGRVATTPLSAVVANVKPLDPQLLELSRILAR